MALTSGFFNSVGGDRKYNAESMNRIFEGIIMRGIMPSVGEKFKVTAGSGMRVYVGSGKFMGKYGHWLNNDTLYEVTLNTSSATVDRYEAITLVVDTGSNARSVSIGHKIYNSRPTSAVFEGNTETYIIAYVLVRKGTSQILQSDITDTRANSAMCGYATNLLEHLDTSDWFTQYQAATDQFFKQLAAWELQQKTNYLAWETQQKSAFDEWFSTLTGELKVGAYIQKYQSVHTATGVIPPDPIIHAFDGEGCSFLHNRIMPGNGFEYNSTSFDFTDKATRVCACYMSGDLRVFANMGSDSTVYSGQSTHDCHTSYRYDGTVVKTKSGVLFDRRFTLGCNTAEIIMIESDFRSITKFTHAFPIFKDREECEIYMSTGVLPDVYTKPNIIISDDGINMPINIAEYNQATDILLANINGVVLVENEEYTISGSGAAAKIILKKQVSPGNKISFTVLKSKIGTKA